MNFKNILPKCKHVNLRRKLLDVKLLSTNANIQETDEKIEIPERIHRGPTDILYALESTIKRDPTAAHFKYHDDPYLIPMSNVGKRVFAMAQESGRKAAHWVRQQNAELFQHQEADPPVEAFIPKMVYTENSEVAETDLKKAINDVLVSDAIFIYKLMRNKGSEISPETRQSFLELLCYFNSVDGLPEEFIEERWFRQSSKGRDTIRKTWKDGELAEEVFISIENPGAEAYSAIVQGMVKYYQVQRAWELFEEAQDKKLTLNVATFNSIIKVVNFIKESYSMRWELITNLLSMMKTAKLKPNLGTMNAILESLSLMSSQNIYKNYALATLAEFKALGIEPSLASWHFILTIFCRDRGEKSSILYDIMKHIENKEHKIQDLKDTSFFLTAMGVCRNHLHDKELAKRVDKLLNYENNYNLIGDSYKESVFYRNYFILLCSMEPFDEFMETTYKKLVPHIYVPEPGVMEEILKAAELSNSIEYLPKLWSDMTIFDHTDRERLLNLILDIMVNNVGDASPELVERFAFIAWDVYNIIEDQPENRLQKLIFTGEMLGNIMLLVVKNKDLKKANQIVNKFDKEHHTISGLPKIEPLSDFVDLCIENKEVSRAINCIQFCSDCGYPEALDFALKMNEKMTLDKSHLETLSKIVGDLNVAKKAEEKSP